VSRTPLMLILFAGTAAWAGDQHGPNTDKRLSMLNENRTTIGLLIENGLDLGRTDDPVGRVNVSRQAAEAVRLALADAAATREADTDRVVELGEHLARLYVDGLTKTLETATAEVPEGSPAMDDLKTARKRAVRDAAAAAALDFVAGKLGGSARVKQMAEKLGFAAGKVKVAAEPKK
jgi:hypothetical protein